MVNPTKEQNAGTPSLDQASAPRAGSAVAGGVLSSNPQLYGIDVGRPGGDMTAISVPCPSCHRLWTITYDAPIAVLPMALMCVCGKETDLRAAHETTPVRTAGAPPNRNHDKDCPCYECANLLMCRACGRTQGLHYEGCMAETPSSPEEPSVGQLTDAENDAMDRDIMNAIKHDAEKAMEPMRYVVNASVWVYLQKSGADMGLFILQERLPENG